MTLNKVTINQWAIISFQSRVSFSHVLNEKQINQIEVYEPLTEVESPSRKRSQSLTKPPFLKQKSCPEMKTQ